MPERKATALVLVELPRKLNYFVGAKTLDLSGGTVCVVYDNGTFEQMPMRPEMETEFDSSHEGATVAKLRYLGQEALFQIHLRAPKVRKLIVKKPPTKTQYLSGEKLDLDGLVLFAEYETGEKEPWEDIPEIEYMVKEGDAVYPLTISGITVPIYIKVAAAKLVCIHMGNPPKKTEYLERVEQFDPTGGTVVQVFDSGAEKEIPLTVHAVRGFSNLEPGEQTLTVQIGPMTTTFPVQIRAKRATRLNVISGLAKTNYIEGQEIQIDGLKLAAEYDNGETHVIEEYTWEPKVAGLDCLAVTIAAEGAMVDIPIGVNPRQITGIFVERMPDKAKYLEKKETMKADGGQLRLEYNFGDPSIIEITNDMLRGFDNRQAGECVVEVQYKGFTTKFSVEITPQQLIGLLVTKMPDRTTYAPGEKFDPTGMTVSGFYNNGLLQPVTSYAILPDRPLEEQDVAVTIGNMDKTAVIPIAVSEQYRAPKPEISLEEFVQKVEAGLDKAATAPAATPSFAPAPPPPEPQKPEAKGITAWGKRLFYPSASKLRGLTDD